MSDNEIDKQLIGYKPDLTYTDEYVSELTATKTDTNDIIDDNLAGREEIDDLLEDMHEIESLINSLPNNVSDIVQEVYDQILDFVDEELTGQIVETVPDKESWEYEEDSNKDDDSNKPESGMGGLWDTDDFFPIKKEEHSEEEIIEKEHIKNLVDLFTDYKTELHNIISNFWGNFFIASNNKDASEIRILLDNILLSSSKVKFDTKHLLDSAVRQQIIKDMKMDYFNMMFNAEETIKQLKQLKAMKELRLRYAKIEEVKGDTKTNQMNNNVLLAAKLTYERKYDIAYENLYRYLNSSNRVLNDTLQTWIQEIKSKQILIEREGIL